MGFNWHINAQFDSTRVSKNIKSSYKKVWKAPLLLMGAGLLAKADVELIGWENVYEFRKEKIPQFHTKADDYLQYAPIAGLLSLNAFGIKGENKFSTQMLLLAKSELLMCAVVIPLKILTEQARPDSGAKSSFPSGHTAQAFVAATFIHKEYGKQHRLYSVLAYTTATSVGILRILNNRHWSTDVLFGAGIGILSTHLVYHFHDQRQMKKSSLLVSPTYQKGNIGLNAIIQFK